MIEPSWGEYYRSSIFPRGDRKLDVLNGFTVKK